MPEEKILILPSGIKIHYLHRPGEIHPQDGRNGGTSPLRSISSGGATADEPVLFIHGYADSSHSFDRLAPFLKRGLNHYFLDLRGHGDSAKPETGYAVADFVQDVVSFAQPLNQPRISLVGHSMGGVIAQKIAAAHPELVSKMILINSSARAKGNSVLSAIKDEVDSFTEAVDDVFIKDFQTPGSPVPASFLETIISESKKVPLAVWQQVISGLLEADNSATLRQITADTLLLYGENDAVFSLADQQYLLDHIPASSLRRIPGAGHAPHWEKPELAAEAINRFLGQ